MNDILIHHLRELKNIDNQRKAWLLLSALVTVSVGFIIFDPTQLEEFYVLGSLGIVLAVVWWYWSMRIINKVISHRAEEIKILADLHADVENLKKDFRKNYTNDVD